MKTNHRRKNKQSNAKRYPPGGKHKQFWLKQRSKTRRQRDRITLRNGLLNEEMWETIPTFEEPVDWYSIY